MERIETSSTASLNSSLYRAVWRWHFYAGLLSLPFLILLAMTGAIYLFQTEINDVVYRDLRTVSVRTEPPLAPSRIIESALQDHPGSLNKYVPPTSAKGSAEVGVKTTEGSLSVFVDPYTGRVLGDLTDQTAVMMVVRKLHSLAYFGPIANGIIEIVGGWTILLVLTGVYLWWPRGHNGALKVRGRPAQRLYWRDVHAVTGIITGFFIVFLAATGMPWSVFWGNHVNEWANSSNYGYPNGVRVNVPMSNQLLANSSIPTTWSLEQAKLPRSESSAANDAGAITIDTAVQIFDELGLAKGYAVSLPSGPEGVFTASVYPKDLSKQRVVHLDQYSGKPLLDMSFKDYGPLGKSLEWGINVHMGQEFGLFNQILMLIVCLAIVLLSVSSGIMWWKRRPSGSLGVPPMPADKGALRTVFGLLTVGGILFPLVGLSMLVIAALDFALVSTSKTKSP